MQISRYHGLGNDFLIAFAETIPSQAPALARRFCDRSSPWGADGLVFGTPGTQNQYMFSLFNADGGRAEVSGNGLACFGHALAKKLSVDDLSLEVDTTAGPRSIKVDGAANQDQVMATVGMGKPQKGPDFAGLNLDLAGLGGGRMDSIDLGNPHLVIEVDNIDSVDLAQVGPAVEAFFMPTGCNVHIVQAQDANALTMRPWERGVGLTEACGTGATATALVAHRWGLVGGEVAVSMPGGVANITVEGEPTYRCRSTFETTFEVTDG
ncbi:MAG TPA: diaminopimelate epimerase [Acidimicrobiia bacterium]|jgi:diaminopimelate epimerase|nr:diaminopimelate epimerase [Acidimicrobiia bacterium]